MKKVLLVMFLCAFELSFGSPSVSTDTKSELAEHYYGSFAGADGTSLLFVWAAFRKEIPLSERDELLASIVDLAAKDTDSTNAYVRTASSTTIARVLGGWGSGDPAPGLNSHLEHSALAQATNKDPLVRAALIDLLTEHKNVKYRELCLSYLEDPDDHVRYHAVDAIAKWSDGQGILTKYIQDHHSNPDHVKSVERAQIFSAQRDEFKGGNSK